MINFWKKSLIGSAIIGVIAAVVFSITAMTGIHTNNNTGNVYATPIDSNAPSACRLIERIRSRSNNVEIEIGNMEDPNGTEAYFLWMDGEFVYPDVRDGNVYTLHFISENAGEYHRVIASAYTSVLSNSDNELVWMDDHCYLSKGFYVPETL